MSYDYADLMERPYTLHHARRRKAQRDMSKRLTAQVEVIKLVRVTDVQTSHDAAAKVPAFKARHEAVIYGAICDAFNGATAKEISVVTGLSDVQINRRLGNMGERKLIRRLQTGVRADGTPIYYPRNGCCVWFRK